MKLTSQQKKQFRAIGHKLKPVVTIAGKGLSENVLKELERAIRDHELIKIKINVDTHEAKQAIIENVHNLMGSISVQETGKFALIYKPAAKPNPQLSNVIRFNIFTG